MESTASNADTALMRHALAHGAIVVALVASLLAMDSWHRTASKDLAHYAIAVWAFLCGLAFSHIIHEWCHYAGARITKSSLVLKPGIHPIFFEFDLETNTSRQFLCLSLAGLMGNFLLLAALISCAAPGSIVFLSLLAAVCGQLVFVLIVELPVSIEVITGKNPLSVLTKHFGQGGPLFLRATLVGAGTAALVFLLY